MVFGTKRGFVSGRRGVQLRLEGDEAAVLAELLGQLESMVEPVAAEPDDAHPLEELLRTSDPQRPEDPALLRLFPDGYLDDTEAADEFRRFTERSLREQKHERLLVATDLLAAVPGDDRVHDIPISPDQATAFLGVLNDLRLVLGVRLGIVSDDQDVTEDWAPDDPRMATYAAYQWLTWLQASLLDVMAGGRG